MGDEMANRRNETQNSHTLRFTAAVAMSCSEARAHLWEFLDGTLDQGMTTSIRSHLARCTPCREQHDADLALMRRVLQAGQADHASSALRERVDALLRRRGLLS